MTLRTILLALALLGGAGAWHHFEQARSAAETARLRADVAALSSAVEDARRGAGERAAPRVVTVAPSPQAAPNAAAPSEPASSAPTPPAEEARPRAFAPAEARTRLDAAFGREQVDPAWSPKAQRLAEERIDAQLPEGSQVRSVTCRASLCRIETAHADLDHYRRFVHGAFLDPETHLWNGGFFSTTLDEGTAGSVVTVAYLAREGEELPPLEPTEPAGPDR